jgi:glucose uptake protein GlcU
VSTDIHPSGPVDARADRRHRVRSQLSLLLVLIVVGVLLAFVWRLLTPYAADLGDEQESSAAVDGTLALLGVPVGALTAAFVLLRPGRSPALRTLTVIVGSLVGAVVSWVLGDQLGTPALRAVGAAFTWPVATSSVLFLGALLPGTSNRLLDPPS